jgi:hypothetical protein
MAALLYGQLLAGDPDYAGTAEVVMLSPYSDVGPPDDAYGQNWTTRGPWDVSKYRVVADLEVLFEHGPVIPVKAFYSDGVGTETDKWHAERLGVTDIAFVPGAGHSDLGRFMRDSGLLQRVIRGGA